MTFRVDLTNVPDGAYTEDYLGMDRDFPTREAAEACVAQFYAAMAADPESFESDMEATIVED